MPDTRRHRSAGPGDHELFAQGELPGLCAAVSHFSWLLTHGYAKPSALKLVGDRFQLAARQREAVVRCASSDQMLHQQSLRRVPGTQLSGQALAIDGYNVLTTVEVALGGGVVLYARDGCARDLASLRGTWRKVAETLPALELVGAHLEEQGIAEARWALEASVSNSGRLRALLLELARERGWPFEVELLGDVDAALESEARVVASADRRVIGAARRWTNLAREIVEARVPTAWVVDLSQDAPTTGAS